MTEQFYVGITDTRWYKFIRNKYLTGKLGSEINFWTPGKSDFKALSRGEMFLFKLHSRISTGENGEIVGGAYFSRFERMSVKDAWNKYGFGNGFSSLEEFERAIKDYQQKNSMAVDLSVGCIILNSPFFFKREDWIESPIDWKKSIVSGKRYSTNGYVGNKLYYLVNSTTPEMIGEAEDIIDLNDDEIDEVKKDCNYVNFDEKRSMERMNSFEKQSFVNEEKKVDSIKKYSWYGIDFGTTNSAAFSFTGVDEDSLIPIHYGDDEGRPFPSVVAINRETGEVICGREAKEQRNTLNKTHAYFSSIKTIIDSDATWDIANKTWTPEDIAAEILKALKKRVEENNDSVMDEVVMAVPVGYSYKKKIHLRNAAQKAGINIKMFISEPTAAFCSNYKELCACKNVAVFDWGGGTLDVVVLKIQNGNISELAYDGMTFAGNDIDYKFAGKMHSKFLKNKEQVIPMEELPDAALDQLLSKCEKAKCDFEDEDIVAISINKYGQFGAVRDYVEYDYFSLLIEQDIDNAIKCLERAIEKAGLNSSNIDRILCVGGSSKLRSLQDKLKMKFGEEMLFYPERVMWDIAKGAAMIATRQGGYKLSKPIGLQLCDGSFLPLFKKGQPIPCSELSMAFGVVDQGKDGLNDACFIFTDSESDEERELYETFILPLRGFTDEYIYLNCYIDRDNVFKVKFGSNRVSSSRDCFWHYDSLKVCFHIEDK